MAGVVLILPFFTNRKMDIQIPYFYYESQNYVFSVTQPISIQYTAGASYFS
jgi:hypothetical protein